MNIDIERHLGAMDRSVTELERDGRPGRRVTLRRTYETTVDDLWDTFTNAERVARWFAPLHGDLRLGGRYQLEGNASGAITACAPPSHLALTWEYGGDTAWVEVRLSEDGPERARLTLMHTALLSDHWVEFGPGAAGVGWELGILGLALHLSRPQEPKLNEESFVTSPDGKAFVTCASEAWGRASVAAGTASDVALAAAEHTTAFYTGAAGELT